MGNSNVQPQNKKEFNLMEIESFEAQKDSVHLSLPLLYHFDTQKKGTIQFRDFAEIQKLIDKCSKKVKPDMSRPKSASIDISQKRDSQQQVTTPVFQSNFLLKDTREKVEEEIRRDLEPLISKDLFEQKNSFLDWMYAFVDVKKEGKITMNELNPFLAILMNDGIDLDSLIYEDATPENIADLILKEYSKNQEMTRDEFYVLGDHVLLLYEKYHVERKELFRVGEWYVSHQLGKGAFGKVLSVTNKKFEKKAMKMMKKSKDIGMMSKLDTEIQAMKLLNHENIVGLTEILQDDSEIFLFMEVCGGGTLYDYLKDVPFSEPIARWYFGKLLDGLNYCHQSGVVHRDLRIENLLLDNKGTLKISDFGHSRIFSPGWDLFQTQMVGSLFHLSPEQIQGKIYSGEKVDIWSCGIILYTFLTSHMPFCSSNVQEMLNDICAAKFDYPEKSNVSESAKQLISRLLQVDPEDRASLKDIKESEWMQLEKEEPKLSILKTTFPVENYEETKSKMMKVLRDLKVHFSAKQNNIVQCVYVLMGLKFHCLIQHNEESKTLDLEFTLNSGDIKEFRKFIRRVEKMILEK